MSHTRNTKHGGRRARPKIIDEIHEQWARDNGYRDKDQASSSKPEDLHAENTNRFVKAASFKPEGPSAKLQASSRKLK
jgi:hypothetical protein